MRKLFGMLFLLGLPLSAEELIQAAYENDLKQIRSLVDSGAAVTKANRYGVTPLSLACQNGNAEMIQFLIGKGADPNTALNGNETVLMTAARTGKLDCIELLLEAGAKVDAKERNGQTAIMWAAAEGHAEVVEILIKAGAEFQKPLKSSGFTPTLFAVRQGHIEVVELFLKNGVDVNFAAQPENSRGKRMRSGTSALMLAVENGHFDLGVKLLEAGADPNDQRSRFTPLHALTWVRKAVKGDGDDGVPPPRGSGKQGSLDMVRALVRHGADVNVVLKNGRGGGGRLNLKGATPFLMASQTADLALLKLLKESGADETIANADGVTPLLAASGVGINAPGEEAAKVEDSVKAVAYLLKLGVDINQTSTGGETVMHGAAYKSAPKMIQFLDENGADIKVWHQKNKFGWTPLIITQGFRQGNFRPIETTEKALAAVMRKHGVEPPPPPKRGKGSWDD